MDNTRKLHLIDVSADTARHTVVAAGTEEIYQGHPTTVLTRTGKLLCTTYVKYWPDARNHSVVSTRLRLDEIDPLPLTSAL